MTHIEAVASLANAGFTKDEITTMMRLSVKAPAQQTAAPVQQIATPAQPVVNQVPQPVMTQPAQVQPVQNAPDILQSLQQMGFDLPAQRTATDALNDAFLTAFLGDNRGEAK